MKVVILFLFCFVVYSVTAIESCYEKGLCLGHLIEVKEGFNTISDCLEECRKNPRCKFASFNSKAKTCTLSRACQSVVLENSDYQHASVKCGHKILIIGGKEGTSVPEPLIEILSLDSSANCQELQGFLGGLTYFPAHGLVNGLPTICGGRGSPSPNPIYNRCYQYDISQYETNVMVEIGRLDLATYSAGYAPWNEGIIITAGNGGLNAVQIVTDQEPYTHPWSLPMSMESHCMVPIWETNSYMLIGGKQDNSISDKTFIMSSPNGYSLTFS